MHVHVAISGGADAGELGDLRAWLLRDRELRGQVRLRQEPPPPGALGALTTAVEVALGPGGAVTAVVGAVIVWLRGRRGSLAIKITRGDDSVELSTQGVRDLDPAELRSLIATTAETLDGKPGA